LAGGRVGERFFAAKNAAQNDRWKFQMMMSVLNSFDCVERTLRLRTDTPKNGDGAPLRMLGVGKHDKNIS
jgi:hypothetical protein